MSRRRELAGELREFEGGGSYGWWARGHLDQDAMHLAIVGFEMGPVVLPTLRYEWWRCVPVGPEMPGAVCWHQAAPRSRGAFPVTVAEW